MSEVGTDDQSREALFLMQWPDGFHCPACAHDRHYQLKPRQLLPSSGLINRRNHHGSYQTAAKTPFVAAVACSSDGKPLRMRMASIKGISSQVIGQWARGHLTADSEVISDELYCFRAIGAVRPHDSMTTGGGPASVEVPEFNWVNTMPGKVKNALQGTYHVVRSRQLGRYLGAFSWRFNRRFELARMVQWLA